MMHRQKTGARAEYRQQEDERTKNSASLSNRFQQLKTLKVDLAYYNSGSVTRSGHIKYTVNLDNAKSVFRFNCLNIQCVGGDFDLSDALANAVAAQLTTATGEVSCQGWRSKTTIDRIRCHNILRYTFSLEYSTSKADPDQRNDSHSPTYPCETRSS